MYIERLLPRVSHLCSLMAAILYASMHESMVKTDINIEADLAYALEVKECPQLLFLKGNKILYREKGRNQAIKN